MELLNQIEKIIQSVTEPQKIKYLLHYSENAKDFIFNNISEQNSVVKGTVL
jgi:hypothetical protein